MPLQTVPVPALGGLDLVSPPQVLSQNPGCAVVLNNYECLSEGGYRRIKGFVKYGDIPDVIANGDVRGIAYYHGIVVVVGQSILHSPDNGSTWFIVNRKELTKTPSAQLSDHDVLPREGVKHVEFAEILEGNKPVLVITDDKSEVSKLLIEGDFYTYVEGEESIKGYEFVSRYQDHVVLAGSQENPGNIAVSARFAPLDFSGQGSWAAQVADEVVGLKTFRDYLYIFCRSSIYRVINLESAKDIAIRPVTTKIGCIDGRTIQEIGGDILFLSDDGLRYLGATERIDDVSINLVSDKIRPLMSKVSPSLGPVSSCVIPSKAQYRLFYTDNLGRRQGVIGTLLTDGSFSWSTTDDMKVEAITVNTAGKDEQVYHIGSPLTGAKRVYYHDVGEDFDGTPIRAEWQVPDFDLGDSAVRKSLHFIDVYLEATDRAAIQLNLVYDRGDPKVIQPEPFELAPVVEAARWGEVKWGEFTWGATRYPLDDVFLEGSGKWINLNFVDFANDNSQYTIRGYDLQVTTAGRI